MTNLKIREKVKPSRAVDEEYPFEDISAGDMFYSYDLDILLMAVENEDKEFSIISLTEGIVLPEPGGEYFEDVFKRLTEEYGDIYPVTKAKLKFTVGD